MSKLLPKLDMLSDRHPYFLSVQMNLTNRCASRCEYCRKYEWPQKDADYEATVSFLQQMAWAGLHTVVFSGGEPLMYERFSELIDEVQSLGLEYSLITTTLGVNSELLRKVARTATRIHVSLDTIDSDLYRKIRGSELKNVISNIAIMKEAGANIRISCTLTKDNIGHLVSMIDFVDTMDLDIKFYMVHTFDSYFPDRNAIGAAIDQVNQLIIIGSDQCFRARTDKIIADLKTFLVGVYFGKRDVVGFKKCHVSKVHCLVDTDGSVYPCCTTLDDNGTEPDTKNAYANIKQHRFVEIMQRKAEACDKYPNKDCGNCPRFCALNNEVEEELKLYKSPIFL